MSMQKKIMVYIIKEGVTGKNAYTFIPEDTVAVVKEAIIKKASFNDIDLKPQAHNKSERRKVILRSPSGKELSEESIIKEVMQEGDNLTFSFAEELKMPMFKQPRPSAPGFTSPTYSPYPNGIETQ